MRFLYLRGSQAADITPLQALTNLIFLDLNKTRVFDIDSLKGLKKLLTLDLQGTQVTDVIALLECPNLKNLYLTDRPELREQAEPLQKRLTSLDIKFVNPDGAGARLAKK